MFRLQLAKLGPRHFGLVFHVLFVERIDVVRYPTMEPRKDASILSIRLQVVHLCKECTLENQEKPTSLLDLTLMHESEIELAVV